MAEILNNLNTCQDKRVKCLDCYKQYSIDTSTGQQSTLNSKDVVEMTRLIEELMLNTKKKKSVAMTFPY